MASKVTLGVDIQLADRERVWRKVRFVLNEPGLDVTSITSAHIPLARIRHPALDWWQETAWLDSCFLQLSTCVRGSTNLWWAVSCVCETSCRNIPSFISALGGWLSSFFLLFYFCQRRNFKVWKTITWEKEEIRKWIPIEYVYTEPGQVGIGRGLWQWKASKGCIFDPGTLVRTFPEDISGSPAPIVCSKIFIIVTHLFRYPKIRPA